MFCFFSFGIAFGYAYLVNETVLPVPFILTGLMIGTFRDKSVLRTLAVFLAAFVAFPIAWLARNAGLPEDAWKDPDTQIFIFSATVFSEG